MLPIDLHVHSNKSDGSYSPTELVDYALEKGLAAFALTDHDTTAGLDEAINYSNSITASKTETETPPRNTCEVIPGIELSTEYEGKDIHILGLYIDYHNADFMKYLTIFQDSRELRNEKMCTRLREYGIDITMEQLREHFPDSVITRGLYAKYMLETKQIKSMSEAFERYIGDNSPCYIPREKVTPSQAVSLIKSSGGIAVLAHPTLYHMSLYRLEHLISQLVVAGLDGLEAVYSTYHASEERDMKRLALKHQLLITGGSDFHGTTKPGLDLGVGYGHLFVPEELLTNIKAKKGLL